MNNFFKKTTTASVVLPTHIEPISSRIARPICWDTIWGARLSYRSFQSFTYITYRIYVILQFHIVAQGCILYTFSELSSALKEAAGYIDDLLHHYQTLASHRCPTHSRFQREVSIHRRRRSIPATPSTRTWRPFRAFDAFQPSREHRVKTN